MWRASGPPGGALPADDFHSIGYSSGQLLSDSCSPAATSQSRACACACTVCVCAVSVSVSECAAWACSHTGDARAMPAPIIQDMMSGRDSAGGAVAFITHQSLSGLSQRKRASSTAAGWARVCTTQFVPCQRRSAARRMSSALDEAARRRRCRATKCHRNGPACTPSTCRAVGSSSPRPGWTVRLRLRRMLPWTRVRRQRRDGGPVRAAASDGRAASCPSQTLS